MIQLQHIYFKDKETFRAWLEANHNKSPGIWLVFYKKQKNIECISYREALEEALCFGWIDSIIKKIDEDKYVRKFTPRRNTSKWSELNKNIVLSLIKEGRIAEAGLKKIDSYIKTGKVIWDNSSSQNQQIKKEAHVPGFMQKAFSENEPAWSNFKNLASGYQRQYLLWVSNAKREATIQKRLDEAIRLLKENKKLGLK